MRDCELISEQLNSHNLPLSRRKISFPWRGHSSDSQGRSSWSCLCCLCWLLFLKGCRGTGPCFSNIKDLGGAWGGWIMSLEMEKQSQFKCQAHKLVGHRIFSSHPWGDLYPLKNLLWSLGLFCCSSRWPLLVPLWSTGSSCPQGEVISSCFSSWATKGGFILCTLLSSQPLFARVQSGAFCAELQPKEKG